tara:strand:- start:133 stop:396 length:264 start_codon:yes stop_codon:yes gene_type:complete
MNNEDSISTLVDEIFVLSQLRNLSNAKKFYQSQIIEEKKLKEKEINDRQICIIFGTFCCVAFLILTWLLISINRLNQNSTTWPSNTP